jgi:shikimate dehydrogenase
VNRTQPRLDHLRRMVEQVGTAIKIEYICNADPKQNDEIMASLPDASVLVNATGMGKDIPGSPITDDGLFPKSGVVWEFNYRGELDFLHQARRQAQSRNVRVEDGWAYFLHGWSQVAAQVLHADLTPELFAKLDAAASTTR